MTAPNLKDPTTIAGKTVGYAVTTTMAAALTNSAASNKTLKVNSVYCANVDGSSAADITLQHWDGTTGYKVAHTIAVPADATQMVVTGESYLYLEEGHSLQAQASAAGDLELVISYEEFS